MTERSRLITVVSLEPLCGVCEVRPGEGWGIPGGAEHEAGNLEESVPIEVFSRVREDYRPAAP